jgi:hypothetical protein
MKTSREQNGKKSIPPLSNNTVKSMNPPSKLDGTQKLLIVLRDITTINGSWT